ALLAGVLSLSSSAYSRLDTRVGLQLAAQAWLEAMAADLEAGARQRLFPGRCEVDLVARSDLFRFDPKDGAVVYDPVAQTALLSLSAPLGDPGEAWRLPLSAFNFDRGERLVAEALGGRQVRVRFPTPPRPGDRILVEYPVNDEIAWWREEETGVLWREWRDSSGATVLQAQNPVQARPRVLCQALSFSNPGAGRVLVETVAGTLEGQRWAARLEVYLGH
ncbi:MAG TPA: hypothetical protein VNO81_07285, partial [Candidatus Nitrosotenuis sp.]|nr:hypothetical protein [Candidatus Nitrosotenuis sp.]